MNFKDYCDVTLDDLKDLSNKYKKVSDFYKNLVFYKDEILKDLNDFTRQRGIIDLYVRDKTSSIQDYSDNLIVEKLTDKFDKLSKEEVLTYLFDLRREEVVQKGSLIKEHYINFDFEKALRIIEEESNKPLVSFSSNSLLSEEIINKADDSTHEIEIPEVETMNKPDDDLMPTPAIDIKKEIQEDEYDYSSDLESLDISDMSFDVEDMNVPDDIGFEDELPPEMR